MYSSVAVSLNNSQLNSQQPFNYLQLYQSLSQDYVKTGFTYKSNQILHKTAQTHPRSCPYQLLLAIAKLNHMNQFEIIFFTHILNEKRESGYENDHENIFGLEGVKLPQEVEKMLGEVCDESKAEAGRGIDEEFFGEVKPYPNESHMEDVEESMVFTLEELKKIYLYLMVIGYAIKYYLNQPAKAKPYEQHANQHVQNFIPSIFNKWARKHGNTALSTTPRKINAYYMGLGFLEGEDDANNEQQAEDCQYRNYNEIVEELIKATMNEGEEQGPANEELEHQ